MRGGGATAGAALVLALGLLGRGLWPGAPGTPPTGVAPARGAERLLWGLPLDVNRDAGEAFEALAGIGPRLARGIVAGRPYCAVRELDRVPGIGPRTLVRITPHLAVFDRPEACAKRDR